MAEWLLWIKDRRAESLTRAEMKLRVERPLSVQGMRLVGQPSVVVPPERHPGEWCLRVSTAEEQSPMDLAKRALSKQNFDVLVCQHVRCRRPLRSVRTA